MKFYNLIRNYVYLKDIFAFSDCSTSNCALWDHIPTHPHFQSPSVFIYLIDVLSSGDISNNMEQYLAIDRALHEVSSPNCYECLKVQSAAE
jgi:hypothetical protein